MSDLFPITIKTGANSGKILAYAPLKKQAKLLDSFAGLDSFRKEIELIPDSLVHHVSSNPDEFRTLMLLPNNKCNFQCAYCMVGAKKSARKAYVRLL